MHFEAEAIRSSVGAIKPKVLAIWQGLFFCQALKTFLFCIIMGRSNQRGGVFLEKRTDLSDIFKDPDPYYNPHELLLHHWSKFTIIHIFFEVICIILLLLTTLKRRRKVQLRTISQVLLEGNTNVSFSTFIYFVFYFYLL